MKDKILEIIKTYMYVDDDPGPFESGLCGEDKAAEAIEKLYAQGAVELVKTFADLAKSMDDPWGMDK